MFPPFPFALFAGNFLKRVNFLLQEILVLEQRQKGMDPGDEEFEAVNSVIIAQKNEVTPTRPRGVGDT